LGFSIVQPNLWAIAIALKGDEAESGLAYDFLSNIPAKIQDVIEDRDKEEILQWINANSLTAALLPNSEADNLIDELTLDTISIDTAVGHDGFIEDNIFKANFIESFDSSQIGVTEVNVSETSFTESSIFKDSSGKINIVETGLPEGSIAEISPLHVTVHESTFVNPNSNELSKAQIRLDKVTAIEIGIAEVSFSVDTTSEDFVSPVTATEAPSGEIFFSPSVLSN
jgi:hypothetical protein